MKKSVTSFIRPVEEVFEKGVKVVSRKTIKSYADDPKKIWKDIVLIASKDKYGKMKGFKVTRIRINSEMSSLGLKQDDIIIRVNNIDMKSYKDAISIYNDIDKISAIEIIVLRNNIEKELVYGIN
jgi:type II secretory pathway component PulC